jgi:beta-galactosidase
MQEFLWKELTVGVCYYPEHWPKTLWDEDLKRMKQTGISVIRIGEFAWNKFEPEEGSFTFTFFDEFLKLCLKNNIRVIMGTPTATPPAWLTEKYPEVLNANMDGVLYRHGGRRHYNYNSPVYQKFCCRIVEKMAEHYGAHPALIGWQIDNELNCETSEFYSEADSVAFRIFLQEKYGSLEQLNEAWGTVFWNQTYTDWSQVYVPRPVIGESWNPHLRLDYDRFVSASTRKFCKMQADIIRRYKKKDDFITTNGIFARVDNHKMAEESLDIYMYDSYPNFAFGLDRSPMESDDLNDRKWSKNLLEIRSVNPHFGIMEQQSGACGWVSRMEGPAPRPGQLALWAMQSVAQGADFVSFFRWRTCLFGTEMYWHGILDYDNRDNRKLAEVKDFCEKLKAIAPVCNAENEAAFALLKDYDNEWDAGTDVWHERIRKASESEIFAASELHHTPYDVIYLESRQESRIFDYPVLVYPHPVIMNERRKELLKAYVENGGILILGCRSGLKDETGKMVMMPQPGLLQELTGTDVREFTFASPNEAPVVMNWNGQEFVVPVFHDVLDLLEGTRCLATYTGSFYAGRAALAERQLKKGKVIHYGGTFTQELVAALFAYTGILEPFAADVEAPPEVELIRRKKGGKKYYFVLNFPNQKNTVRLKCSMKNLYTGNQQEGEVELEPFETVVFEV